MPEVPSETGQCFLTSLIFFPTLSCHHTPLPLTHWQLTTQQSHIWDLSGMHYLMMIILVYSPTVLPHVTTHN